MKQILRKPTSVYIIMVYINILKIGPDWQVQLRTDGLFNPISHLELFIHWTGLKPRSSSWMCELGGTDGPSRTERFNVQCPLWLQNGPLLMPYTSQPSSHLNHTRQAGSRKNSCTTLLPFRLC